MARREKLRSQGEPDHCRGSWPRGPSEPLTWSARARASEARWGRHSSASPGLHHRLVTRFALSAGRSRKESATDQGPASPNPWPKRGEKKTGDRQIRVAGHLRAPEPESNSRTHARQTFIRGSVDGNPRRRGKKMPWPRRPKSGRRPLPYAHPNPGPWQRRSPKKKEAKASGPRPS